MARKPKIPKKASDYLRKMPTEAREYFREEGRRGGLTGGKKRAQALSPERRQEIARKAAAARWGRKEGKS